MEIKLVPFLMIFLGAFTLILFSSGIDTVQAESARSVKTEGIIGFYGKYESENEPKPIPPSGTTPIYPGEESQNSNEGKFPKTGQLMNQQWFWLGLFLVFLVLINWIRNSQKRNRIEINYK